MDAKTLIPTLTAGCLVLALCGPALAATQVNTSTAIGISPNPVTEGQTATLTGTLTNQAGGAPISGGNMNIQQATNHDLLTTDPSNPSGIPIGDPVYCGFGGEAGGSGNYPHITWVGVASGTTDGSGNFSTGFVTSVGMGGQTIGFRAQHPEQSTGGSTGYNYKASASACLDLAIDPIPPNPGCTPGATIAVTRAGGDGTPPPGSSGPWTFRVTVTACGALTGVTAQGGANGWAGVTGYTPDTGSAAIRKSTKKNTILLWTIGDMTDGQSANLDVTVSGTIPGNAPDCQLRYLSGPWSALYTLPMETTATKSDYSGRAAITVDTNNDGNPSCP